MMIMIIMLLSNILQNWYIYYVYGIPINFTDIKRELANESYTKNIKCKYLT